MSKILLSGEKYRDLYDPFCSKHDITPLYIPDNPYIDSRLSGHADLNVFQSDNRTFIIASYLDNTTFSDKLKNIGCTVISDITMQTPVYPMDCSLNAFKSSKLLIYSPKATSKAVIESCSEVIRTVPVNQGYIRCSVCMVGTDALITADRGINAALKDEDVDVLEIAPGHIELPGYGYGFIGGASFMLDENTVVFTGSLNTHPDGEAIRTFIYNAGLNCIEMSDSILLDTGSAFIINI